MSSQRPSDSMKRLSLVDILVNINHEINAPLNVITGFSEILEAELQDLNVNRRLQEYLSSIKSSGKNLFELFHNVFAFTQSVDELGGFRIEQIDLRLLAKTIFHIYKSLFRELNVEMGYLVDSSAREYLSNDRERLILVLNELIVCLINRDEKLTKLTLEVSAENNLILFRLFADYLKPVILNRESTEKNREGVSVFNKLSSQVEQVGGTLDFEVLSPKNRYLVEFRVKEFADEADREGLNGRENEFEDGQKVLIVDDNPLNQKMMGILMDRLKLEADYALNGKEALEYLETQQPDFILMDIEMPVMNGIDATRLIKSHEKWSRVPLAVLSANAFKENIQEAFDAGADHYLTKPIIMHELLPVLQRFLVTKTNDNAGMDGHALQIPPESKDDILKKLKQLKKVPYYLTSQISRSIADLEKLATGSGMNDVLRNIENAYFNRRHEDAKKMIVELISKLEEE